MCREQLLKENITEGLFITGNTEIDAVGYTVKKDFEFPEELAAKLDFSKRIIFVTAHRRENLGEPLENICRALARIAETFDDVQIVYLVHLNPAVRKTVNAILSGKERVLLTDPPSACRSA